MLGFASISELPLSSLPFVDGVVDVPGTVRIRDRVNNPMTISTSTNFIMTDQLHGGVTISDEEN